MGYRFCASCGGRIHKRVGKPKSRGIIRWVRYTHKCANLKGWDELFGRSGGKQKGVDRYGL